MLLLLKLFIVNIVYLHIVETFSGITIDQPKGNLATIRQNMLLCSTDLNTIHLIAINKGLLDESMALLTRDCPFKTLKLSEMDKIPSTTLQYHSEVIVFMVTNETSIHYFRRAVSKFHGSNSRHRFLMVFQFKYDLRLLVNIFKQLASKTIYNIAIIMSDDVDEFVSRYDPFDETFDFIDNVTISTAQGEPWKDLLFVRNRSELRGRNLVVSMHEQMDRAILKTNGRPGYTGVDGLIADFLEERMNVTFTYTTPQEMYNGNKNSCVIGALSLGQADMSFNADSLALFLVNDTLDVTEPIERNDMCILVPKAGHEPITWNLLRTLSKVTWMVTVMSIVGMMLIYRCTQGLQKSIYSQRYPFYEYSWAEVSTIIYQSFYGDAIKRIPTSIPLRILIIGWVIYSFLITNAFQAKLISSLVLPKELDDIETIEQLGHSNLKIMFPKALANHIKEYTDNRTMSILRDQLEEVDSWSKFDASLSNKSFTSAFVMMRFHADLVEKRNFDKAAGRPFYKMMGECLLTFPRVYFLKLGSMYVEYVSELLRRFHETGFIVKWMRDADFTNALHGNVIEDDGDDDNVDESTIKVVISTEHLLTSFYLWLIGLVAATLTFICENLYFRWSRSDELVL